MKRISRWSWGLVSSAEFSVLFFVAVAAALFAVPAVVGYAVVMG